MGNLLMLSHWWETFHSCAHHLLKKYSITPTSGNCLLSFQGSPLPWNFWNTCYKKQKIFGWLTCTTRLIRILCRIKSTRVCVNAFHNSHLMFIKTVWVSVEKLPGFLGGLVKNLSFLRFFSLYKLKKIICPSPMKYQLLTQDNNLIALLQG